MTSRERELISRAKEVSVFFRGQIFSFFTREGVRDVQFENGQFIVNGQKVQPKEIQKLMRRMDTRISKILDQYADKLVSGEWDLEKWKEEVIKLLEGSHVLYAALALGSFALAVQSPATEKRIIKQVSYLSKFEKDLKKVKDVSTYTRLKSRLKSYVRSFHILYEHHNLQLHKKLGFTEAKRILTAVESCGPIGGVEGCIDYHDKWVKISEMPSIGTLVCGQYCKCYLIYRY